MTRDDVVEAKKISDKNEKSHLANLQERICQVDFLHPSLCPIL